MDGGASWAAVHGVAKSRTRLSNFTFHFHALEKEMQPTPVFLPGESKDCGDWWAAVYGVAQSRTGLKRLSSSSSNTRIKNYWGKQLKTKSPTPEILSIEVIEKGNTFIIECVLKQNVMKSTGNLLLLLLLLSRFSHVRLCAIPLTAAHQAPRPWDLQARTLEWVAISFSNAWKWKVKVKWLSRI